MSDPTELSCQELVELVTDYLEEVLSTTERARFETHLRGCDGCDRYLAQMRQTIRALGHLREEEIAPATRLRLLAAFRDWKRPPAGATP